MIPSNANSLSK